jgi:hypothetical protein
VVEALAVLRRYARRSKLRFYAPEDTVPIEGIVPAQWRSAVVEDRPDGSRRGGADPLRAVCAGRAAGGGPPP